MLNYRYFILVMAFCLLAHSPGDSAESIPECKISLIVESQVGGAIDFGMYVPEEVNEGPLSPDEINQPRVIVLDSKDNLYVADPVNYRVLKFNQAGKLLLKIPLMKPERTTPTLYGNDIKDMAIDKSDCLYVINYYQYRIEKYSSDGRFLMTIDYTKDKLNDKNDRDISSLFRPEHIQVDHNGNIYLHSDLWTKHPKGGIYSKDGRLTDRLTKDGVVPASRIINDKIIGGKIVNKNMVGPANYYAAFEGKNQSELVLKDLTGKELKRCGPIDWEPTTRDFVDRKGNVYFIQFNKANVLKARMLEH